MYFGSGLLGRRRGSAALLGCESGVFTQHQRQELIIPQRAALTADSTEVLLVSSQKAQTRTEDAGFLLEVRAEKSAPDAHCTPPAVPPST